jgi:hypothetical protein
MRSRPGAPATRGMNGPTGRPTRHRADPAKRLTGRPTRHRADPAQRLYGPTEPAPDRPGAAAGGTHGRAPWRGRERRPRHGLFQLRQVSLSVSSPLAGTVTTRLVPLSQVAEPLASMRTYLYSTRVPAGSSTSSRQMG